MSPDVNSLASLESHSYEGSHQPRRTSSNSIATASETFLNNPPSPRASQSSSLHAAAAINAGLQRSPSSNRSTLNEARRRSSLVGNINNPDITGPGEMQSPNTGHGFGSPPSSRSPLQYADPNHHRAPSLGQIHQELENEQEAQVVRWPTSTRRGQDINTEAESFTTDDKSPTRPDQHTTGPSSDIRCSQHIVSH